MKKPEVLIVYKESAYTRFFSSSRLSGHLKKGKYWKIIQGSHQRHNATLNGVKETLRALGIGFKLVLRNQIQSLSRVDEIYRLVVSVGGDGTLLDSSHHLVKVPILGVNSDPLRSVARFSACDVKTFPRTLGAYLSGRLNPILVPRLEFSINGQKSPWLVLNDLLAATSSPAGTSRYVLKIGSKAEEQMSSGLWISSAAGSTAAILSAGGRVMPLVSRKFQYVVREVYQKKFGPRKLLKGILGAGEKLEVVSRMKEGRLFVDGTNLVAPFKLGDKLRVGISRHPLKVIGLKK